MGAGLLARISGDGDAIGLDMGGTSCDVCVVERGRVRQIEESRAIAGRVVQLPMVDVHTVGAGGGSIGWRDHGGALRCRTPLGGADPGPACYGRGGTEPTVTDANLVLGRLAGFRACRGVSLDQDAASRAVGSLAGELGLSEIETAEGIVRLANQEMARALPRGHRRARRGPEALRAAAVRRRGAHSAAESSRRSRSPDFCARAPAAS